MKKIDILTNDLSDEIILNSLKELMIYKSYIIEQNINAFKNNIILFYGENLGMKNDFKDQIKKTNNKIFIKKFLKTRYLLTKIFFFQKFVNESLLKLKRFSL